MLSKNVTHLENLLIVSQTSKNLRKKEMTIGLISDILKIKQNNIHPKVFFSGKDAKSGL